MKKSFYSLIIVALISAMFSMSVTGSVFRNSSPSNSLLPQDQKKAAPQTKEAKAVYTCPMHPEVKKDAPGKCPTCKMDLVKKDDAKVSYTCPMHPEVVSDKPGKCPKCKMNLEEKKPAKKETPAKK